MVEALLALPIEKDVLVIDDNSPDGSGDLAEQLSLIYKNVNVLHRAEKMGLGTAYVQGFHWAIDRKYDVIVQMDCDFSHNPADALRLVGEIEKGADLAIGSRYVKGGKIVGWGWKRHIISRGGNIYAGLFLGFKVRDLTGGFKAWRREVLETIDLKDAYTNGYGFQIETTYKTLQAGFNVREIPITFKEREVGTSKMGGTIINEAMLSVIRLRLSKNKFKKIREEALSEKEALERVDANE
jgi:dolichol-phosphate mannosyltransferase